MSTYIKETKTNSYKYRRKVPSQLKDYLTQSEITKSLGKNELEATKQAVVYNKLINESIEIVSISAIPVEVKRSLIAEKLSPMLTISPLEEAKRDKFIELAEDYLQSLTVSESELKDRSYILLEVFPSAFSVVLKTSNPQMTSIDYNKLIKVRDLLQQLPKRNIEKYRRMPLKEILKGLQQGSITPTESETISTTTLNKYIKWLNALMTFAVRQKVIPFNPVATGLTIKRGSVSREERKDFTKDDLEVIEANLNDTSIYPVVQILRYTGMRLSELFKCKITEVEGILCFDLRTPIGTPLKTLSSYRLIPVHDKLLKYTEGLQGLLEKFCKDYISKRFKKDIDKLLESSEGKSLYSLRHTFATTLIANSVQPEVVSELMGHAHSTMTMNRYVKGFPIKVLKEAIDKL